VKLLGRDAGGEDLVGLLGRTRWAGEAWALLEGSNGVYLGPAARMPREASRFDRGRVFWRAGELRWLHLGNGRCRIVYLGEDESPVELPSLQAILDQEGPLTASSREIIARDVGRIDFGGNPPSKGETVFLRWQEYRDGSGRPAFARLAGVVAR